MAVILGTILIILMIVIGEERGVAGVFVLAGNMILLWMCIKFIADGSSVFLVLFIGSMISTENYQNRYNNNNRKKCTDDFSVTPILCK